MSIFSFLNPKKSAKMSKKLKKSSGAPKPVQDTVSPAQPPSLQTPSTQPSLAQQPAAGAPSSSTSALPTHQSVSVTPAATDNAATSQPPSTQPSLVHQPAAGAQVSSASTLPTHQSASVTPATTDNATTPQSPSTQLPLVQQPAAGAPNSSTSTLPTHQIVSATPTTTNNATTPEAPRQAHAESSQKYEKVNDTSVLFCNIVKDFSEADGMFAPLKATMALLIRGLETTKVSRLAMLIPQLT